MSDKLIGVAVNGAKAQDVHATIQKAEAHGVGGAWLTTGGARIDSLTVFASVAEKTSSIKMGTSIVPTFPRHPLVVAQQAQVVDQLAPGRVRVGVGPSHRPSMAALGIRMQSPLGHLREYLHILKSLLQKGSVDFDGDHYQAHDSIAGPLNIPVMASALRQGSFELCGEVADGAISWVCPRAYLRDSALPAMQKGADAAGRAVPPLIAHAPVVVHDNYEEVRTAFREQFGNYPRLPFYRRMLIAAGYPEARDSTWSDAMIEGLVIWGDEGAFEQRLQELFACGATEVLASPILVGQDRDASLDRTLAMLGKISKQVAA
jgi:F420-dependent oxidoreductase-like protein